MRNYLTISYTVYVCIDNGSMMMNCNFQKMIVTLEIIGTQWRYAGDMMGYHWILGYCNHLGIFWIIWVCLRMWNSQKMAHVEPYENVMDWKTTRFVCIYSTIFRCTQFLLGNAMEKNSARNFLILWWFHPIIGIAPSERGGNFLPHPNRKTARNLCRQELIDWCFNIERTETSHGLRSKISSQLMGDWKYVKQQRDDIAKTIQGTDTIWLFLKMGIPTRMV